MPFYTYNEAVNNVNITSLSNHFFIQLSVHVSRLRTKLQLVNAVLLDAIVEFVDVDVNASNAAIIQGKTFNIQGDLKK